MPKKLAWVTGIVVVSLALCSALLLGSLGWFMVGFGTLTDCTNAYNCTETGCAPCRSAEWWINGGALAQLLVAGAAITVLCVGILRRWRIGFVLTGVGLLALSVLAIVVTTELAQGSY